MAVVTLKGRAGGRAYGVNASVRHVATYVSHVAKASVRHVATYVRHVVNAFVGLLLWVCARHVPTGCIMPSRGKIAGFGWI